MNAHQYYCILKLLSQKHLILLVSAILISFSVKGQSIGSVTLSAPSSGSTYYVGSSFNFSWSAASGANAYDFEYDTGQSYAEIVSANGTSRPSGTLTSVNLGTHSWRVRGKNGSRVGPWSSTRSYTVANPTITLNSPNGGESWTIGSAQTITWSAPNLSGNIKIEINGNYSSGSWETLFSSIPNDGSEQWTVTGAVGAAKRIRITSVNIPSVSDFSSSNFSLISPSINVTTPNGGETWTIGSTQNITWTSTGISGNVKIEANGVYPNGSWQTIIASTANDGSASWPIEGEAGTAKRIRITSISNPSISDISNNNFTLVNPTITLTSPNGGESWATGSTQNITWSAPNLTGNVKIEANGVYPNGEWKTIVDNTPNDGSVPWFVEGEAGNAKRIRVSSMNNPSISDFSSSNFTLTNPVITITSPSAGENWAIGLTKNITWTAPGLTGNVKIEVNGSYPTGQWEILYSNTVNDGSEQWLVSGAPGTAKRIRITSVTNPLISSISNANFTMIGANLTLITPNGGETWVIGATEDIKWNPAGVPGNVKIEANGVYPNGEWKTIVDNTPNDGSAPWLIEGEAGNAKRLRITSIGIPSISSISQGNFTLTSANAVISPNGGEKWRIRTHENLKWFLPGVSGNVKIETNGNYPSGEWRTIIANTPNDGDAIWYIEEVAGIEKRIRVTSIDKPSISTISKNNFELIAEQSPMIWMKKNWTLTNLPPDSLRSPGKDDPNNWSGSTSSVWVKDGELHMKIREIEKKWYCAEIVSEQTGWGFGEYTFQIASPVNFEKNVVLGLFTYQNEPNNATHNEIDIEFAKWNYTRGYSEELNSHHVYQNLLNESNITPVNKFSMKNQTYSTHKFVWTKNRIFFQSYNENSAKLGPRSDLISDTTYTDIQIPEPDKENLVINLWLAGVEKKLDKEVEVIIKSFDFNTEADFEFKIENIGNSPSTIPGLNGKILMYDLNYNYLNKSVNTNSASIASFGKLTFGKHRIFETYHTPSNPSTIFGQEFWGSYQDIHLLDYSVPTSLKRIAPFADAYKIYNNNTNQDITGQIVPLGTPLRIEITVKNPDVNDKNVKTRFVLDRDKTSTYDLDQTATVKLIPKASSTLHGSSTFSYTFTPTSAGDYFGSVGTMVNTTATNFTISDGWPWGATKWITIEVGNQTQTKPTLSTKTVTSITKSAANSGGEISTDGGASVTARGVCWSTIANPTISNSKTTDGTGSGNFNSTITGLNSSTTYHVRAYATNSVGTSYGSDISFTTSQASTLVSLTTNSATAITQNTASSGGIIITDGGSTITAKGICWSTTSNPTTSDQKTNEGNGNGIFTSAITGLNPNTRYYIRAYATNSAGTAYGENISFTTLNSSSFVIPTISTDQLIGISTSAANGGGNILSDGGASITTKGVCWGLSSNPTTASQKTVNGTGSGNFTSTITGLTAGTTYHVRAYASNSVGTAYGSDQVFTTSSPASQTTPVLSTTSAYAISATSLQSGGSIISDGGTSIVGKGICWDTSSNPTTSNQKLVEGTGLTSFTSSISGLMPGTTYHVRAYATNTSGTAYGNNVTLTTSVSPAQFSLPASNFKVSVIDESCMKSNNGKIIITVEKQLKYTASIKINGHPISFPFTTTLEVDNLEADNYEICITVDGEPDYRKCFTVTISEPKSLSLFSTVNNNDNSVNLQLGGAAIYYIDLNGNVYSTDKSTITLPLIKGINKLSVSSDIACQGIKSSTLINDVVVYPVPFFSKLNVVIYDPNSIVEVYSLDSKRVFSERFSSKGAKELDLSKLSTGIYILRLKTDQYQFNYKIIKQ